MKVMSFLPSEHTIHHFISYLNGYIISVKVTEQHVDVHFEEEIFHAPWGWVAFLLVVKIVAI